jgi:hypothetical protein
MSTSEPTTTTTANTLDLQSLGITVQPGRQTTQTNGLGAVVQGTLYPIVLANGTTSSVFIPDSTLPNLAQVEQLFTDKVNALNAIPVG